SPLNEWDDLWLTKTAVLGSLVGLPEHQAVRSSAARAQVGSETPRSRRPMNAQELLQQIADYCRHSGLAESTFGRRAVNDGKLTARLRNGGRITTETLDRIRDFMDSNQGAPARAAVIERAREARPTVPAAPPAPVPITGQRDPQRNFRFFEHPATVLGRTNLAYADAPWLAVKSLSAASSMVWHEVPLVGNSAYRFEQQITDLVPFLSQNWKAGVSPKTGNPVYERPVVL